MGNWGGSGGAQNPFTFTVNGGLDVAGVAPGGLGSDGRVQADKFCFNGGACITTWPSGGSGTLTGITPGTGISVTGSAPSPTVALDTTYSDGRYVQKTGDTMTGLLTINPSPASDAIFATGPIVIQPQSTQDAIDITETSPQNNGVQYGMKINDDVSAQASFYVNNTESFGGKSGLFAHSGSGGAALVGSQTGLGGNGVEGDNSGSGGAGVYGNGYTSSEGGQFTGGTGVYAQSTIPAGIGMEGIGYYNAGSNSYTGLGVEGIGDPAGYFQGNNNGVIAYASDTYTNTSGGINVLSAKVKFAKQGVLGLGDVGGSFFGSATGVEAIAGQASAIGLNAQNGTTFVNLAEPGNIGLYTNGSVGLGTLTPASKLDITGGGGNAVDERVNGRILTGDAGHNGGVFVSNDASTLFVGESTPPAGVNRSIGLWDNGNWRLTAWSDGTVGIGTGQTPTSTRLTVQTNGGGYDRIDDGGCGATWAGIQLNNAASNCQNYALLGGGGTNDTYVNRGAGGVIQFREANAPQVTIASGGNVGIATSTPSAKLDVYGNMMVGVGSPTDFFDVNGTAGKPGGGSWNTYSDARLKNVQGNFSLGLDALMQLNPVEYRYKDGNALGLPSDTTYTGVVAQQVQQVVPQAVTTDSLGYLEVNNDPIIWTMVNSIKELKTQNDTLAAQNQQLSSKLDDLEARVAKLEAK